MIELILIVSISLTVIAELLFIKNEITYINMTKIINAIFDYRNDCFVENKEPSVHYYDMKSYYLVFLKLWDFGYKHILPPEKYEIIKEYIK